MWGRSTKRSKALKNWHSKAMLIDPNKTRIIIINVEASNPQYWVETAEPLNSLFLAENRLGCEFK